MELTLTHIAILGGVGGLIPDVLRAIGARHDGAPPYLSSWFFWFSLVLLVALGAGTAYAAVEYASAPNSAYTALGVGYGAPSVISKLLGTAAEGVGDNPVRSTRDVETGSIDTPGSGGLRGWWAR